MQLALRQSQCMLPHSPVRSPMAHPRFRAKIRQAKLTHATEDGVEADSERYCLVAFPFLYAFVRETRT